MNVILKDENLSEDLELDEIARTTLGYSGSDLHELCRCEAMNSFIESIKSNENSSNYNFIEKETSNLNKNKIIIRKIDFDKAFEKTSVKRHINSYSM